jgi:hypothetical protein
MSICHRACRSTNTGRFVRKVGAAKCKSPSPHAKRTKVCIDVKRSRSTGMFR